MKTSDLELLVMGVKTPPVKKSEIRRLVQDDVFQEVAQSKSKQVAQEVAQTSWVAQSTPQKVAQSKPKQVAQVIKQRVVYNPILEKDIEKYKEQIFQIQTIEGRKKFCLDIGFGIAIEKRAGKQYYLFGIKKIQGKKYRLYIGNSKSL